jgi:uncharacterized membrane protein YbhN (UPF0104 family)
MSSKKPPKNIVPENAISVVTGIAALIVFTILVIALDNQSSSATTRIDRLWSIEKWALATATIAYGMVWFARFVKRLLLIERNFYIEFASIFAAAFASAFLLR